MADVETEALNLRLGVGLGEDEWLARLYRALDLVEPGSGYADCVDQLQP